MSLRLDGSCETPLGAYAEIVDGFIRLRGFVASPDGSQMLSAEANGSRAAAESLGRQVADLLLTEGARALLKPAA
jgi:hydroxymethylbilane synthase